MTVEIVVARFQENVEWVGKIGYSCIVYSDTGIQCIC